MFVVPQKELIFADAMRKQYSKMTLNELQVCYKKNSLTYVCKDNTLLTNYIPGEYCEATLLRPSTNDFPKDVCTVKFLKLPHSYWIPLATSNQWLYIAPFPERMTVLCEDNLAKYVNLENRGK